MPKTTLTIGQFFETYRIKAGHSLDSAAQLLEIGSSDLLAEYEAGRTLIPLNEIFSMANLYNIPPNDVIQLFYNTFTK